MFGRGALVVVGLALFAGGAQADRESLATTVHARDGISGFPPSIFSLTAELPPACMSLDGNRTTCALAGERMRWVWFDSFPATVRFVDPLAPAEALAEVEARGVDSQGTFGTVAWWNCGHVGPTPLVCGEAAFHSVRLRLMEPG